MPGLCFGRDGFGVTPASGKAAARQVGQRQGILAGGLQVWRQVWRKVLMARFGALFLLTIPLIAG